MMDLHDNIRGVSCRTGPNGWMDQIVFHQWLKKARAISRDPQNRQLNYSYGQVFRAQNYRKRGRIA